MNKKSLLEFLKRYQWVLFIGLLLIAWWLRMHQLEDRFYFFQDEENIAMQSRHTVLHQPLRLIGIHVHPIGVYRTPYFIYFAALFLKIFNMSVLGHGVMASLIGVITIGAGFFVFRQLFGQRVAWVTSILAIFSFRQIVFNQNLIEPLLNPLAGIMVFYLLVKIVEKKKAADQRRMNRYWYFLVSVLSIFVFTDPSVFPLLVFAILVLWRFKVGLSRRQVISGLLVFFIWALPLGVFEMRHDFYNFRTLIDYFGRIKTDQPHQQPLEVLVGFLNGGTGQFIPTGELDIAQINSYCPDYLKIKLADSNPALIMGWLVTMVLPAIFLFKFKRSEKQQIGMIYGLILIFLGFVYFWGFAASGELSEVYFSSLWPFFFLLASLIITRLFPRWLVIFSLVAFLVINISATGQARNSYGLKIKQQAVIWTIRNLGDKTFSLESYGKCFALNGYHYLFFEREAYPVQSYMDPYWGWMTTAKERPNLKPEIKVVFYNHQPANVFVTKEETVMLEQLRQKAKKSHKFGLIEVLLLPF